MDPLDSSFVCVKGKLAYALFLERCQVWLQGFSGNDGELHVFANNSHGAVLCCQITFLEGGTERLQTMINQGVHRFFSESLKFALQVSPGCLQCISAC